MLLILYVYFLCIKSNKNQGTQSRHNDQLIDVFYHGKKLDVEGFFLALRKGVFLGGDVGKIIKTFFTDKCTIISTRICKMYVRGNRNKNQFYAKSTRVHLRILGATVLKD